MLYTRKYYFLLHTCYLLDKISLEIELSGPSPFEKDRPALVPILHISISSIQNNSFTYFSLSSLFYKFTSSSPILRFKKLTIEIKEVDNVSSDVKMQSLSFQ